MLTNPRDAFRGQSRSPNVIQFSVSCRHTAGGDSLGISKSPTKFLLVYIFERHSGTSGRYNYFFLGHLLKMLPPGAIFKFKIHQNVYAAVASPRTPLGETTELPRTPYSWFSGSHFPAGEGRGKRGERRERRKGRGIVFPTSFFTT